MTSRQNETGAKMKLRTWPLLAVAFGALIFLFGLSGISTLRRAQQIFREISSLHQRYQAGERVLNELRSEIHYSGVLVRDFLLDRSELTTSAYREQLLAMRAAQPAKIEQLRGILGGEEAAKLDRLRQELDGYWDSLEPMFEWSPGQKLAFSSFFLRRHVLPKRDAALGIARELRQLNQANLHQQQLQLDRKERELPVYVGRILTITLVLGVFVAIASILRITQLERRSEAQRRETELAEQELRRLSHQLVKAHEDERRVIARELHDEIGQMLTAQRMALRNLKALRNGSDEQFLAQLEDSARLSEEALRAVRGLAMGLRPSMLDDLGLAPALDWQAREFSRRFGVPVTVQIDGDLDGLSDAHRTCIYRVVQEALTNCAKHAHAKAIRILVAGREDRVSLTIQDDGTGFRLADCRGRGLGLIGIEERVKELGGRLTIVSIPGRGTVLSADIPIGQQKAVTA